MIWKLTLNNNSRFNDPLLVRMEVKYVMGLTTSELRPVCLGTQ
jgi:hypothetical protein